MQSRSGSHNLLSGLYRTISHCLSPTDMAHASGSQALLSVLDGEDSAAQQTNGGGTMHLQNGVASDEFYGEAPRSKQEMRASAKLYT